MNFYDFIVVSYLNIFICWICCCYRWCLGGGSILGGVVLVFYYWSLCGFIVIVICVVCFRYGKSYDYFDYGCCCYGKKCENKFSFGGNVIFGFFG